MKSIRIGFSSSWATLDPRGDLALKIIGFLAKYRVEVVPPTQADYLIYTVFNGDHHHEAKDGAIKILYTGENFCPDFNACDYAISFEYLDYGDRHLRFPLYLLYPEIERLAERNPITSDDLRARKHFCNFIYSNGKAEPQRDEIFRELNRRMPVHSAGRHMQNTAGVDTVHPHPEPNMSKRLYMAEFRFSLALENSTHPGYVTEKIADAFIARTIPIYWGDPRVAEEFNADAFVNVHAHADFRQALDFVGSLNSNENNMLDMLNAPPLRRSTQISDYRNALLRFLENIFDQDITAARRRPRSGFAANLERRRRKDGTGYRKHFLRNRV